MSNSEATRNPSILVLASGGADSFLLLHLARQFSKNVTALSFRYGQVHEEELDKLPAQFEALRDNDDLPEGKITEICVDLSTIFRELRSNLLQRPHTYAGVHTAHVPARNAIFLSVAMGLAESNGCDEIWYGANYSDLLNGFPDCTQEWVRRMDLVARVNGSRPLRIRAPLLGLSKDDVFEYILHEGYPLEIVYSGYGNHLP